MASKQLITELESFEELNAVALAWTNGLINNLWINGYAGSGKSTAVRQACEQAPRIEWVTGHMTPKKLFELMCEWENRGIKLVVFDDVQAITRNVSASALLKQAMSGDKVEYNTTQKVDVSETTVGYRFCVITNDKGTPNEHIGALQSRSMCVEHTPTFDKTLSFALRKEIINQEVYNHINFIGCSSQGYVDLRTLSKIQTLCDLGFKWKEQYQKYV